MEIENVLSVFDGISCGQLALNKVGVRYERYLASEIDISAINIAQQNFPKTNQLGDISKLSSIDLPKIDLLIGGSPCQGFSFAGKGLNFDDPRSKLFFEFVRLKNETNPEYWLLENVVMKREYQDVISNLLGVHPILINSACFSAQNRKRLYWTNIPVSAEKFIESELCFNDILDTNESNYNYLSEKRVKTMFAGYRSRIIKNYQGKIPTILHNQAKQSSDSITVLCGGRLRWLTRLECERAQTLPDNYTKSASNFNAFASIGNGWTVDVICEIFKGLKTN